MMFHKNENSGKGGLGGHASNQPPVVIESPVVYKFPHMTNADKIRLMSDEELAEFLLNRDLDVVEKASKAVGFTYKFDRESCLVNVIDWLKEEASTDAESS